MAVQVQVAAADARGLHLDQDFAAAGAWIRSLLDGGLPLAKIAHRSHCAQATEICCLEA
jgi:hypothetical protein